MTGSQNGSALFVTIATVGRGVRNPSYHAMPAATSSVRTSAVKNPRLKRCLCLGWGVSVDMTSLRRDVIARLYIGRLGNARANLTPNKPLGRDPAGCTAVEQRSHRVRFGSRRCDRRTVTTHFNREETG